jgi:hypothetical protein
VWERIGISLDKRLIVYSHPKKKINCIVQTRLMDGDTTYGQRTSQKPASEPLEPMGLHAGRRSSYRASHTAKQNANASTSTAKLTRCRSQLEMFDGTKDPLNHLETYNALMHLQMVSSKICARALSTMLKGSTRRCMVQQVEAKVHLLLRQA